MVHRWIRALPELRTVRSGWAVGGEPALVTRRRLFRQSGRRASREPTTPVNDCHGSIGPPWISNCLRSSLTVNPVGTWRPVVAWRLKNTGDSTFASRRLFCGTKRQRKARLEAAPAVLAYLEAGGFRDDVDGPLFRPVAKDRGALLRKSRRCWSHYRRPAARHHRKDETANWLTYRHEKARTTAPAGRVPINPIVLSVVLKYHRFTAPAKWCPPVATGFELGKC